MSDYTKSTNFATKDTLTSGDPLKIVKGTEIDTEFTNIATAVNSKVDESSGAMTGGAIDSTTIGATTPSTGAFTTLSASSLTGLTTALAPQFGGTGVLNNSAATVTSSGNFPFTRTLTATTNVTFPITGTLATLAGTETLTNKTLTTPVIASISNSGTITVPTGTDTLVGKATTDTLTNKTLTNPTVTNYVESVVAIGNSSTSQTLLLTNGTVQTVTMTGNCTFTMPTATAGKSFVLITVQDATGSRTATFTSVKWPSALAPTLTTTASTGRDILTFFADGTNWYGTYAQNFS